MPDLFMERVENDADWTLFCPKDCGELADCYGEEFKKLYEAYEADEAKSTIRRTTIKARALWTQILGAMVETGTPYIMFKDTCNARSNQKHLGVIKARRSAKPLALLHPHHRAPPLRCSPPPGLSPASIALCRL